MKIVVERKIRKIGTERLLNIPVEIRGPRLGAFHKKILIHGKLIYLMLIKKTFNNNIHEIEMIIFEIVMFILFLKKCFDFLLFSFH